MARKIKIISNNICYGPCPKQNEIVEQHITINNKGSVWYSEYIFGNGVGKYDKSYAMQFKIDKDIACELIKDISNYFMTKYLSYDVTDVGSWNIEISYEDGSEYKVNGPLISNDDCQELKNFSTSIRNIFKKNDLYIFDGENIN